LGIGRRRWLLDSADQFLQELPEDGEISKRELG
jgi:hypothetical protein